MSTRIAYLSFILFLLAACTSAPTGTTPVPSITTLQATSTFLSLSVSPTPQPTVHTSTQLPVGWTMFHGEESHSGVAFGKGNINPQTGAQVLATYRLFDQPHSPDDMPRLRWTSTLPLADLNGDGRLEIVVTTPDVAAPTLARLNGEPIPNMVEALQYIPNNPNLQVLWSYKLGSPPGKDGIDTYSPALADANGDGLPDVIFTARDKYVRALSGVDGSLIWKFDLGAITEAGPMLSDLNNDGIPEVIIVTDCKSGGPSCSGNEGMASVYVLPLRAQGDNQPLWKLDYPYKMDSAEPVIAEVMGLGKVILAGTWGGELLAIWRTEQGEVRSTALKLREIEPDIPGDNPPVIRVSPLVDYTHNGPMVVFGWLPSDLDATNGRLTAARLRSDNGSLIFQYEWTLTGYDTWKSSPALIPQPDGNNLIVAGYGLGIGPAPTQSGSLGSCVSPYVFGGVLAVDESGNVVWDQSFGNTEGNLRASAAVADIDGDGQFEVIIPAGCYGKLHVFDAMTGATEWSLRLGPLTQTSPSIGDLNGDGNLKIVLASYDGLVYVLGAK